MTCGFVSYQTAAKGLALTTVWATSALNLWAPSSLTARSAAGDVGVWLSAVMLVLSAIGWADIVWTDIRGKLILPSLPGAIRHQCCVALYAVMGGLYGVFGFAATDPAVNSSWILIVDYLLVAVFSGALATALALEGRK